MYKLLPTSHYGAPQFVLRTTDNTFVPLDPANSSYQDYLKWVEDGNTPEPADEPMNPESN